MAVDGAVATSRFSENQRVKSYSGREQKSWRNLAPVGSRSRRRYVIGNTSGYHFGIGKISNSRRRAKRSLLYA